MDSIKKQASKLREQVAKQQQAVLKQFSGRFPNLAALDEVDIECHQKLRTLYSSTRAIKHLQKDLVRAVDGFISIGSKQMEISTKLAESCCRYGKENESSAIAKASLHFGNSHKVMENERENLLKIFGEQVFEPIHAMILSAPLEDARHLTYRYEKIKREVEAQAVDVARRQLKTREASANEESMIKLQNAEVRLSELKSALSALGREATSAMVSVESQQQDVTFQKLLAMVDAERIYHQNVASVLDKLHAEMVQQKQMVDSGAKSTTNLPDTHERIAYKAEQSQESNNDAANGEGAILHIAEVVHPFDAQADGELTLSVGDYVAVRKVSDTGWSEGEFKGNTGWFPSAYVVLSDKAPANEVIQTSP